MITPEQLAACGTEDGHQAALFCWCQLNADKYPQLKWLFHIPNGGYRDAVTAGKLKAQGVKPGVPDLMLPIQNYNRLADEGYLGLFIELKVWDRKTGKNKLPTEEQKEWLSYLHNEGYKVQICWGWEQARDVLIEYLR